MSACRQSEAQTSLCTPSGLLFAAALGGVAALGASARAQAPAASFSSERVGPSFACPTPRDPLGQLICGSSLLARRDLEFVQTYQALRQQSSAAEQQALRVEAVEFSRNVRSECSIGPAVGPNAPVTDPPSSGSVPCVEQHYMRQRDIWATRLTGAAREEAQRDIGQQIALQRDLQQLGLLSQSETIDGVYGSRTRMAIMAFQQTLGTPTTGLIGDDDALALSRQVAPARSYTAPPAPLPRTAWEDFRSEAAAMGVSVSYTIAGGCTVMEQIRNPAALSTATSENLRDTGGAQPGDDATKLFAAEVNFLRTQLAARSVRAFYATQPLADLCRFDTVAYTADIYGRDVEQPLFSFGFDRATASKIVWDRFDPANLPKVVLSFEYGSYAKQRLRSAGETAAATPLPVTAPPAPGQPTEPSPALAPTMPVADPSEAPPAAPPRSTTPAVKPIQQALAASHDNTVAHWAGSSSMITRPFHVSGAWELRWTSGGMFNASLHRVGSNQERNLAFATEGTSSSAYQPDGGDYYIEFTGTEPWMAEIVSLAASSPN